jgi:hypothetical protein
MAYLVLLSFDDEEQAMTLVEGILDYPDGKVLTPVQEYDVHAKVEAIYKKPTMFCETFGGCTQGSKKNSGGWTMGQRWGWWVCAVCKKPSRHYWLNVTEKQSSFGKNLLDRLFDRETKV